jgi:hypothetical protein
MSIRWIIGLGIIYVVLSVLGGIGEQVYLGSTEASTINTLFDLHMPAYTNVLSFGLAAIQVTADWIQGVWQILTFDYSFFQGEWIIVRYVFCAFGAGIGFGLVMSFLGIIRGGS